MTDEFGVIHEDPPIVRETYDRHYVEVRYDAIPEKVRQMSMLRVGFLIGALRSFASVLDVGYGNGDFLRALGLWPNRDLTRAGYDVSGYPVPEGCQQATWEDLFNGSNNEIVRYSLHTLCGPWDVVTFFDSLEHFPSLDFLGEIKARHIIVTAPWYPGPYAFAEWKHRRPGEHLHHFTPHSLACLMRSYGYKTLVYCETLEDGIRPPHEGEQNTFTAIYRKV